jgi:pimeloyl-ACP methyl ester carboxylesterase
MDTVLDVQLTDGRTLRVHDSGGHGPAILWHHGSPQTGALLDPLVTAAESRGIRLFSYGRPSYGGSSPNRGRSVGSAAADVLAIVDELEIDRFATMGASGGGPNALACAALLPDRVVGVATFATLAPISARDGADGIDWFAGMASDASLKAAIDGVEARTAFAEVDEFNPASFNAHDYELLDGTWSSLGADVGRSGQWGSEGIIDDDVAYVNPWGFEPSDIEAPTLLAHGGDDRVVPSSHSLWLSQQCSNAELWLRPRDGHIGVLQATPLAMDWLLTNGSW